jgi:hypothetical protein
LRGQFSPFGLPKRSHRLDCQPMVFLLLTAYNRATPAE